MLKFSQQGVAFFNSGQISPILHEQASPMIGEGAVFRNRKVEETLWHYFWVRSLAAMNISK